MDLTFTSGQHHLLNVLAMEKPDPFLLPAAHIYSQHLSITQGSPLSDVGLAVEGKMEPQ
jgi:hypothetical protein